MTIFSNYNIPFLAALAAAVLCALLQIFAGGEHDSHGDGHDTDVDVDADADLDVDTDSHLELDTAHDSHAPAGATGLLGALGIGRVPLMLVLMGFLAGFGAVGLLANALLTTPEGSYPGWGLPVVLLASLLAALLLTNRISRLLERLVPRSTTAVSFEQLVGRVGTVVTPTVSQSYGRVQVRDIHGSLHTVYAVVEGEPILDGAEVALLHYDQAQKRFIVRPMR